MYKIKSCYNLKMGSCNCKCVSDDILASPRQTEENYSDGSFKDIDIPTLDMIFPSS